MKLVQTLSAIALIGAAAPSAFALSVKDDQLSVNLKFQVQTRAYLGASGEDAAGNDYDPLRGVAGQEAEAVRFDLRRARLGFAAKYGDAWTGNFMIRAENNDRNKNDTSATGGGNRGVQLYYANGARLFKQGDDIVHDIHFGLDKPFNGESSISSTAYIMPQERWGATLIETRNIGIGYGLRSPFVNFGVDFQNNSTGTLDGDAADELNSTTDKSETNGYSYSGRIEFMPGKAYNPGKRQESYTGKEGTHLVLGFDLQINDGDLTGAAAANDAMTQTDTTTYGPDLLVHWNFLTVLAEYRVREVKTKTIDDQPVPTDTSTSSSVDGEFWSISAGWAFPVSDMFLEPSIRYGERDSDKDVESNASYGNGADNGADGSQIEVGLSLYISGHNNKLQLAYQNWKAEDGDAKADIIRLQHQWAF